MNVEVSQIPTIAELSGYMVDKADIDALLEIAKKHAVE